MSIILNTSPERGTGSGYTLFARRLNLLILTFLCTGLSGQELWNVPEPDSILPVSLEEVVLIGTQIQDQQLRSGHALDPLDRYLESGRKVEMIKRGAYAWEPMVNGMSSERLVVTLDGMRIFSACTDKMDPVTSYVDVSNLKAARIRPGQQGSKYGSAIGGGIDLELDTGDFSEAGWEASLQNGFETNNAQKILGADGSYSGSGFYVKGDLIYRQADTYHAGGGAEVPYSQFTKTNLALHSGLKVDADQSLRASLIFDEARDVGYPALPMDVSLARGILSYLAYEAQSLGPVEQFESKVYFNTIRHVMDDSQRPEVAIRMDMPGWSDTFGFVAAGRLPLGRGLLKLQWDGYLNRSLAEMTMYPENPDEPLMFMLTWPDLRTAYSGAFGEYLLPLGAHSLRFSSRIALQGERIADPLGLSSLRIFYPDIPATRQRLLSSLAAQWQWQPGMLEFSAGMSYGQRAPSVSEGYGFYLFNSFDNYDYIGNPDLRKEQSWEATASVGRKGERTQISLEASYFHMPDFILGEVDPDLSPMTPGARGVRVYSNLGFARQTSLSLQGQFSLWESLLLRGTLGYRRGTDQSGRNLPLISPLAYSLGLEYTRGTLTGDLTLSGAGTQRHYSAGFGEDATPAYAVVAAHLRHVFRLGNGQRLGAQAGVENLFDTRYSTFSDWANIPRMGRNFQLTLTYEL